MANTASPLVLDSPSSTARASARRKPETPRQAGNRLVIRINRNGQQPGGPSSSSSQQQQQQDQQPQVQQQQQQAGQPEQPAPVATGGEQQQQQQQQRRRGPRGPAEGADSDVIIIDSDSGDEDEVVITGVTLAKKRPRPVLQQQQQQRAPQQPQQRGMPAMPTWDPPVVPQRERSPEPAFKCLICLDGIKADSMATTPCGHMFCYECIQDAVRATKKCPKCRKGTTLKQIKRLYPN